VTITTYITRRHRTASNCLAHAHATSVTSLTHRNKYVCQLRRSNLIILFLKSPLQSFRPGVFTALPCSYSMPSNCFLFLFLSCPIQHKISSSSRALLNWGTKTKPTPLIAICRWTERNKSLEWLSYPAPAWYTVKRGENATACFGTRHRAKERKNMRPGYVPRKGIHFTCDITGPIVCLLGHNRLHMSKLHKKAAVPNIRAKRINIHLIWYQTMQKCSHRAETRLKPFQYPNYLNCLEQTRCKTHTSWATHQISRILLCP